MSRFNFGGGAADWAFDFSSTGTVLAVAGATVTFWDSLTAGNQYGPNDGQIPDDGTGLIDSTGTPISSVTCDVNGEIPDSFSGPDGIWKMAADANNGAGPRRWLYANNIGDVVNSNAAQIASLTTQVESLQATAPVFVYWNTGTSSYPQRPAGVGAPVFWVGPAAPPFGNGYAIDGLDYYLGPAA